MLLGDPLVTFVHIDQSSFQLVRNGKHMAHYANNKRHCQE